MKNRQYNHLFKMVLVGNSSVGKSSIVLRFADGEFNETYITTIGVDFRFKSLEFEDRKVKLQIWDTAGQQRFRTITSSYYKGAHAIIITYDITSKESFKDATNYWYQEIRNYCSADTEVMLIGNKSDLGDQREVPVEEVQQFCKSHGMEYIQTSAKESDNIEAAFIKISKLLIKRQEAKQQETKNAKPRRQKRRREEKKGGDLPQEVGVQENEEGVPQKLITSKANRRQRGCCPI